MSAALDAILSDHEAELEVCIDIYSAKRSDGTLKTWTFSTHGRDLGSGLSAPPYLMYGKVGPLTQSLSEDLLFGGLAESSAGSVTIVQPWPESSADDFLSTMLDYTFAGYKLQVRMGKVTSTTYDTTTFPPLRTAYIDQEPTFSFAEEGPSLSFPLSSALQRMMNEPLIVKRYVGIPTCLHILTSTGTASRVYNSAYDLRRFTVMGRFRTAGTSLPPGNVAMMRKLTTITNCHFNVRLLAASGVLEFVSSTGTAADVAISSATDLTDAEWHTFVAARNNDVTAYLMVDNGTPGTATPTGQTDIPSNSIEFGVNTGYEFYLCDCRLYDRYITPDEARAISSVRADGDDLGVVGMWRFDDNAGTTANDYSANNLDASISGTVNVDWKWDASDLGEAEIAGRPYPVVCGLPKNCQAHRIDTQRDHLRLNDTGLSGNETIKTQGSVLTETTDYTDLGNGLFSLVATELDPITFDMATAGNDDYYYASVAARLLMISYSRIAASTEEDDTQATALSYLCPWTVGYFFEDETNVQTALAFLLGSTCLSYREDENGKLFQDFLLPPLGLGPSSESMLDLRGKDTNYVAYPNIGSCSSSMTVACWVRVQMLDQTAFSLGQSEFYFVRKGTSNNYALSLTTSGAHAGKLKFDTGAALRSNTGLLQLGRLYFIAGVFDDTANTQKLYCAEYGTTLVEVASATGVTATPTTNSQSLYVGGFGVSWGAVSGVQVWTTTKTLANLQALMATPPVGNEANLAIYAPLANGDSAEVVTSSAGTLTGNPAWNIKIDIDLDDTPSIELVELKRLAPAWKIVVRYSRNWHQMADADIDAALADTSRIALKNEWLDVRWEDTSIRDTYENARQIVLDSPLVDREDASRLLRYLVNLFTVERWVVRLEFPAGLYATRLALGLAIGDQCRLTASSPTQLASGLLMRVTATAPNVLAGTASIALLS